MIQYQVKLRLGATKESQLNSWLFMLTGVWNFAVRKIELDAKDGIYYTSMGFQNLLADHGKKIGIPKIYPWGGSKTQLYRKPAGDC